MRNADEIDWARRYGKRSTLNRFLSKIDHSETGCWLWNGYTHPRNGYGIFRAQAPRQQAHRVMFELYYGRIPEGMQLDHICRVRQCVNPEHLEPVTPKENNARAVYPGDRRGYHRADMMRCKHGHDIDPGGPYHTPKGLVLCTTCVRRSKRESYLRRREAKLSAAAPVVGERGA